MIKFTVYGKPQGKGRPRFRRIGNYVNTYTPKNTHNYEEKIKNGYLLTKSNKIEISPIKMKIIAYFEPPKSLSGKKKEKLLGKHHTKKPDIDNIIKIVCDALNKTAYNDDNQISLILATKKYDSTERIEIEIEELE